MVSFPRRSTLTPSFPARLNWGRMARTPRADSGPKIVYWGKPRRGMPPMPMLERERRVLLLALLLLIVVDDDDGEEDT